MRRPTAIICMSDRYVIASIELLLKIHILLAYICFDCLIKGKICSSHTT